MTDTDRRTEPALTPEQWAGAYQPATDEDGRRVASVREWRIRSSGVDVTLEEFGDDASLRLLAVSGGVAELDARDQHALAALALYGQPFGFTREDVRELACVADELDNDVLHSIARRLDALLPTE